MSQPIRESLKILCEYFSKNNIPYVVVGGVAVLYYGRARMTTDIDIILDHNKLDHDHFVTRMQESGFDITLNDLSGLDEGLHISMFLRATMFRIDMKGAKTELEIETINAARNIEFEGISCILDSPSSIIPFKLHYGSEQDYEDALAIYIRNKETLDLDVMRFFASKLNIVEKLDLFLEEMSD